MLLRLTLPAIALIYATGCCCCGGGGSSSSSSKSSWREAIEEEAAEAIAERVAEAATGAEDVQIEDDGTFTIKTPDGEAVITGGDDAATFSVKTADGETMDMGIGGSAKLPADFPMAMPSSSTIAFSNDSTQKGAKVYMVMAEHPGMSLDDVIAHWEGELTPLGKLNRTEMTQDGEKAIVLSPQGQAETMVAITSADGKVASTVTLRVPTK